MFADRAKIIIRSGKGGNGHVSFRREKYVPNGGPDGGDGGKGGDVIFVVDKGLNNLSDFRHRRKFSATDGEEGKKRNCHGKSGEDLILKVPEGTVIKDAESGRVIADMSGENQRVVVLKGGNGGLGNQHFATSTMQAPKYAKPGEEAIELEVALELKVLADVGLVGFPNAGKSTLLSRISNAKPEIANYPFTTLHPILGVVDLGDGQGFVMADIPGLIEGASEGVGLGHEFLRHIERTKVLVQMVDAASTDGRDPLEDVATIISELEKYGQSLLDKPRIIAVNKLDAIPEQKEELLQKIENAYGSEQVKVMPLSAVTGEGVAELKYAIAELLSAMEATPVVYASEFDPMEKREKEESFSVSKLEDAVYLAEGPKIDKMLGYTNLESEKGFLFFQRFMEEQGIIAALKEIGLNEGDTVCVGDMEFEYFA